MAGNIKWYKVVSWIGLEEDFDPTPLFEPTSAENQASPMAVALMESLSPEGIMYVDGVALFPETEDRKAPMNGGNHSG